MEPSYAGYPTDLSDLDWERIRPLVPATRPIGALRTTSMRSVINAILYRERSGCPWRMLPRDFPHWRTVYGYARQWRADGTWRRIRDVLCHHPRGDSAMPGNPLRSGHAHSNRPEFSEKFPASQASP
jgi:transposase